MKHFFSIILYISVISLSAHAQLPECNIRTFTIRDGLAAHTISSLCQTDDNLMWISTWNGLSSFDGYNFHTFRDYQGAGKVLTSNRFLNIKTNTQKDVWAITYDHMPFLFDTHACRYINIGSAIEKKYGKTIKARTIFPLKNGHSWVIGRDGSGNYCVDDSLIKEGKGIEEYTKKNGKLIGESINKVYLDQYGTEWIFTTGGSQTADGSIKSPIIYDFLLDIGKDVVMASPDGHLAIWRKGWKHEKQIALNGIRKINGMVAVGDDKVAIATDQGIVIAKPGSGTLASVALNAVEKVFADHQGNLWAFTSEDGVWRISADLKDKKLLQSTTLDMLSRTASLVPFFHEDPYGTIWIVPNGGTFSYYDDQEHRLVPYILRSQGLFDTAHPSINKAIIDRQGNLWFTGEHDLTYVGFRKMNYTFHQVVPNDDARAVMTDHKGNIWVGMASGEVAVFDRESGTRRYLDHDGKLQDGHVTLSNRVYAIMEDNRHRVWIGTKGDGIYLREENGTMTHLAHTDSPWSLLSDDIYDFDIDPQGRIWIATYGAGPQIVKEKEGKISFIHKGNILKGYPKDMFGKVRRITHLNDGTMLLSTNEGLVVMQQQNHYSYACHTSVHEEGNERSILTSDVMQTLVASNDSVYIITMGGGIQSTSTRDIRHGNMPLNNIISLNKADGMIQSAIEDSRGRIWIVRENSMDMYYPSTDSIVSFGITEWGKHANFTEAKPRESTLTHEIIMASYGGAMTFSPEKMTKSSYRPKIVFTGVRFQGEDRMIPVLNTDELDVKSDRRNLTIYFSALDYRENYQIRYAYKIDGMDKEWTYVGNSHSASFNNLPCGHIQLLVKSTNSDGVWQNNIHVLKIYSHPTFWETGWAKLLYLIILGGLIALGIYIYTLRAKIRQMMERLGEHIREMREHRTIHLTNPEIIDEDTRMMDTLSTYLNGHIAHSELKVEELADAVHMGRTAFQQKIKEITGKTPMEFVRDIRMERAVYLLEHSSDTVNQIAYAVGFSDPKYFSKVFKKHTGKTPSEYRKEE